MLQPLHLDFQPFPVLTTERLVLRQIAPDDVQAVFELRSDPTVMHFIARPVAQTLDDAMALIELITQKILRQDGINWGIALRQDPRLIGIIGYATIAKDELRAEVGYMLHRDHQGQGLTTEALAAVLRYGFQQMRLQSIEAVVHPQNATSVRVLEKVAFQRDARVTDYQLRDGRVVDALVFSLQAPGIARAL